MVEATRELKGKTSHGNPLLPEFRCRLRRANLGARCARLGNREFLSLGLDVVFRRTTVRIPDQNAAENNIVSLRRLALNLLRREKTEKRGSTGNAQSCSRLTITCLRSLTLNAMGLIAFLEMRTILR